MGYKVINLRAEDSDVRKFDEGLKAAQRGLKEAEEVWEDMKRDLQMRGTAGSGNSGGGPGQRMYNDRYTAGGGGYMGDQMREHQPWDSSVMISERDWQELQERRRRDSEGRFM